MERTAEKRDKNRRSRYNNDRWKLHRHTSRSHRLFEPRLDGIWGRKGDAPQKRRERVQLLLFRKWIGTQLWNLSLGIRQGSVCADKQYYQVYSEITETEYRNYYVAVLRLLINWLLLKPHSKIYRQHRLKRFPYRQGINNFVTLSVQLHWHLPFKKTPLTWDICTNMRTCSVKRPCIDRINNVQVV